jgi:hypothetical protein
LSKKKFEIRYKILTNEFWVKFLIKLAANFCRKHQANTVMPKKPMRREFNIWLRRAKKLKARKFQPPVVGKKTSLEESNRVVLNELRQMLGV